MANSKVFWMIAVTLVIVAYAQETSLEDLELAESKGKKHTRHIQPNNRPSPQRFRPRIRNPSGRGRSDSSENGDSNGDGEYDANNDGYIIISYGGSLGKGKKGQRYGNKYGSDYSVEVVGNVYGYEDDHGYHGGLYDDGYHEQDNVKGSFGTGGGIGDSTGSKGNSESTITVGDAGGSVTSGKDQSEGSKGNSESISETTGGDVAGSAGSVSDAAVTSGDAMGGKGSMGESMSEGTKGDGESMADSTANGGDTTGEGETMGETETMSDGSKGTGEPMDQEFTGGDEATKSEMESTGDVKEGDAMEGGGEMDDMESMSEVSKGESMDAGGDESEAEGSMGTSGSMTDGEDTGGDAEKSNSEKGSSETDNKGTKGSAEAGGSVEESDYIVEVEISPGDELEDDASNKGSLKEANTSESPAMAGKESTSSVTMEMEKGTGTILDFLAPVSSSATSDKGMSLVVIDEMLKMAEMIKIDEMIKNGEMDKVDELLKNAEMIKPEGAKDSTPSATVEMEKASGDGTASSNSGSNASASQRRNGRNGSPRSGKQENEDWRPIIVGKRAPVVSTKRVKQEIGSVSSKPVKNSSVTSKPVINSSVTSKPVINSSVNSKKPVNAPVNIQKVSLNAGSPRIKPVKNQEKPVAPINVSGTSGNRDRRRPSGNAGKVSSFHPENRAKKEIVPVSSKPTRNPIKSVDKEKKLPDIVVKVNSPRGNSSIRPVDSLSIVDTSNNGTTNSTASNGERRFFSIGRGGITFGNRGKQEKVAASGNKDHTGPGNGEKFINRGVRTSLSKPAQIMKPPSKLQANQMMGGTRPTFFTESRLKGETTTEKSIRNEKGGKTPKTSVKEKRGISSSSSNSSININPVSNTSAGKGEKGSKGSDSSKGNGKKETASHTTESASSNSPGNEKKGSTTSENGEKQNSGFVRNASPLSIVRYLRKGVGRFL